MSRNFLAGPYIKEDGELHFRSCISARVEQDRQELMKAQLERLKGVVTSKDVIEIVTRSLA